MNKTYNMNLGGMPFQIDDEAYDKLNAYLSAVKRKFSHVQGNEEIVEDIEARMAEMFHENMNASSRKIVSLRDVNAAIEAMGRPEEFEQGYEEEETTASYTTTGSSGGYTVGKRLYRDPDDKVLGGVISGLAKYFGFESPTWMRILWAALPFLDFMFLGISTGLVILTYIVLWIAVPRANTATQKMQMRGEKVDLDNIERKMTDEFSRVKKNLNSEQTRAVGRGTGEVLGALVIGLGKLLLAFGLFIAGMIALGLIIAFLGGAIGIGANTPFLSQNIFGNSWMSWVGILGLLLLCFAPLVFIITLLIKLLFKTKTNMPAIAFGTLGAFILGCILTAFTGFSLSKDFTEDAVVSNTIALEQTNELYLFGNEIDHEWEDDFRVGIDESILKQNVDLKILPSVDSIADLHIKKRAKGKSERAALARANGIDYHYKVAGNRLTFDEELMFNKKDLWRDQEVDLELRIPENTILHFDDSVDGVLRYAKIGGERYRDWELTDHGTWQYTNGELVRIDADGNRVIDEEADNTDDDEYSWDKEVNLDIEEETDHVELNLFGKEILKLDVVERKDGDASKVELKLGDRKTLQIDIDKDGKVIDIDEE